MGGDVTVRSVPGEGSTFVVTLHLEGAGPALGLEAPATRYVPAATAPRRDAARILVVDDHPVNREVICRQLELLGLSAEVAEDGAAALALWRKAPHALVLLDLHMPVLDGFGLAAAIRGDEAVRGRPRTGLIAVTADALKGEDVRCYAAGMDAFLPKPVSVDALARALARWIPDLAAGGAASSEPAGALFDPEALRSLFGVGARLAAWCSASPTAPRATSRLWGRHRTRLGLRPARTG